MGRDVHVLRVFTRGDVGGNHLGVVMDPAGLGTETMQEIAADLGFSETTFVHTDSTVPYVRIFTPVMEIPFAGHPLVGTAWALDALGPGVGDKLECGIGDVEVRNDGRRFWIRTCLDQPVDDASNSDLPRRAGMARPNAASLVEMPGSYLILEYSDAETIAGLDPEMAPLREVFGALAYARAGPAVRCRFWAPGAGVPEDPATGSAAVALAAALVARGEATGRVAIDQGQEIGFPSRIELSWTEDAASIGGTTVHDETRLLDHWTPGKRDPEPEKGTQ